MKIKTLVLKSNEDTDFYLNIVKPTMTLLDELGWFCENIHIGSNLWTLTLTNDDDDINEKHCPHCLCDDCVTINQGKIYRNDGVEVVKQ